MIIQTNPLRFIGETETREVIFPFNPKIQLLLKSRSPSLRTVFLFSQPFSSASVIPPFQEMLGSQQCSSIIFSSTVLFSLYHWEGNTPEKDLQDETELPLQGSEVIHPAGSPEEQSGVEMLREQNRAPVCHCSLEEWNTWRGANSNSGSKMSEKSNYWYHLTRNGWVVGIEQPFQEGTEMKPEKLKLH